MLAVVVVVLHVVVNVTTPYEFHRDEFLYFAMGRHLELFRMDFPPGIALLAEATRAMLGDSLAAIRFLPGVGHGLLTWCSAAVARQLFASATAGFVAALAVALSPLFLRTGSLFQPVIFDQLTWTAALLVLLRLHRTPERTGWWALLGLAIGVGLLIKFSIAFIAIGIGIAVLVSPVLRSQLATGRPYLAAALVLAIGAPSLIGQIRLDWPVFLQLTSLADSQLRASGHLGFATGQLLFGPVSWLALGGMIWALGQSARGPGEDGPGIRGVGLACLTAFLLLLAARGKDYYFGSGYPVLAALGTTALDRLPRGRRWLGAAAAAALIYGAVSLPLGLPIVPPARLAMVLGAIGGVGTETNTGGVGQIPQDYADMLGWQERVRRVARVYDSLSPGDRADAVIVAENYGQAGALQFYGPRYRLPNAISPAGTFWHFGPGLLPGRVVVAIGVEPAALRRDLFDSVAVVDRITVPYAVAEEQGASIVVARGNRTTVQALWPRLARRY